MRNFYLSVLMLSLFLLSCTNVGSEFDETYSDSSTSSSSSSTDQDVNQDILDKMASVYFWRDSLPSSTDLSLDTETFFESLRYRVDNSVEYYYDTYGDRFSSIEANASTRSSSNEYTQTWGLEFIRWNIPSSSYVILQIAYVVPDSPADNAGLKRGDLISKINSSFVTSTTISTQLEVTSPTLTVVDGNLNTLKTVGLVQNSYTWSPLVYSAIIEGSSPKTAYFAYTSFEMDTYSTTQLKEMFGEFSAAGVENVIVDLRYNLGGYTSTATLIASALTPSASDLGNTVMYQAQYNASSSNLTPCYYYTASGIGGASNHVAPSKVAIIATGYTASASELTYIALNSVFSGDDCILVGETTYGKNLGSTSYYVDDWILHPITARAYDRYGVSGYEEGIDPDVAAEDLDTYYLTMEDLGEPSERMLSAALSALGVSVASSKAAEVSDISDLSQAAATRSDDLQEYTPSFAGSRKGAVMIFDLE